MKTKLLTICLLLFTSQVFADEYFRCGNFKFKISEPLIGFDNIYVEKQGEWKKTSGEILKDKIILTDYIAQNECNNGDKCKLKLIISRLQEANGLYEKKLIALNDCSERSNQACYEYKKGDTLEPINDVKYCSKLKPSNE